MNIHKAIQSAFKLHQAGKVQQAEIRYRKILQRNPRNFDALHMFGVLCSQRGDHDSAIMHISRALLINPASFYAQYNLGNVFKLKGKNNDAIIQYKKALHINPAFPDACFGLGEIYQEENKFDAATYYYKKTLEYAPSLVRAYHNLGDIYLKKGRFHEAIAYYQNALRLNPDLDATYNNLGIAMKETGKIDDAITCYRKAIALNPRFENVYYNLGNAFREGGKMEEAQEVIDMALRKNPKNLKLCWAQCMSQFLVIYPDQSSIETYRNKYRNELLKLHDGVSLETQQDIQDAAEAVGSQQPFYLAYQGFDDREMQKTYGTLVHRIMSSRYPQFAQQPDIVPWVSGMPLKIGVVSGHFYQHTVWKLFRGWVKSLDRQRFSIYGYYTGTVKDVMTESARQYFTRFVEDVYSFEELCNIIHNDKLHVLIYPEIGMDPMTIKLAALRLAPVQCVSWGHPETSGLPTIDYFLSSALMEPQDGDSCYTESLIRLPNISISYEPLDIPIIEVNREMFGLRRHSVLYLSCQSLFKYLPVYDEVFPRIARRVHDCQFLFISHKDNHVTEKFRIRIDKVFQGYGMKANKYVVFLPRLDPGQYFAVNRLADVYLDSIGWSGGNTTLEAVACNLPLVTLPGRLMRSRHSMAILTMMGVKETIAESLDEYIDIASRLGNDLAWRHQVAEAVQMNKETLYRDKRCVTALEDFFEKAVNKACGNSF